MEYIIENGILSVTINSIGAEITSVKKKWKRIRLAKR